MENRNNVEKYLVNGWKDLNDDKLDILGWWKSNTSKYKTDLKVAQHVLAIPISIMAYESTFNTSDRILDQFLNSLSPATIQALIRILINDFETYKNLRSGNFSYKLAPFILWFN